MKEEGSITVPSVARSKRGYRVRCQECKWTGYRNAYEECCCYDEWALYCRPWSPGPGCPSYILWPCPRCKSKKVKEVWKSLKLTY